MSREEQGCRDGRRPPTGELARRLQQRHEKRDAKHAEYRARYSGKAA